jgi:hypothetical protein
MLNYSTPTVGVGWRLMVGSLLNRQQSTTERKGREKGAQASAPYRFFSRTVAAKS